MTNQQAAEYLIKKFRLARTHAVSWLNAARRDPSGVFRTRTPDGRAVTVTARRTGARSSEGEVWSYEITS